MSTSNLFGHLNNAVVESLQLANAFYADNKNEELPNRLEKLSELFCTHDSVCRTFSKNDEQLCELMAFCPMLLSASYCPLPLKQAVVRLLNSIARLNVQLRNLLAGDLSVCGPLYILMKHGLQHETGPRPLSDILRLLVLLTYDSNVSLQPSWFDGLTVFVVKEICRPVEVEWTSYCLSILANLYTKSSAVRSKEHHTSLCRRLLKLLEHRSTVMVVCSLTLINYCDEQLRDQVYSVKYLSQTYQCVFNILARGDDLLARHYAADLITRLISPDNRVSTRAVQNQMTAQIQLSALLKFAHLPRCLEQCASQLATLDPSSEALAKVYDLLLVMSDMDKLSTHLYNTLRNAQPFGQHLVTPVLAMCQAATSISPQILHLQTPLKALNLLTSLIKDCLENTPNSRVTDFIPEESLVQLVDTCVKTRIDTSSSSCNFDCKKLLAGLKLAAVICAEEELRNDMLDTIGATLCAHIAETQLATNPIVISPTCSFPSWSTTGASIVISDLQLLACFKDFSKPHKDMYWRLLKDKRLIDVLGYCLRSSDSALLAAALHVLAHCSQVHNFDYARLSAVMASHTVVPSGCTSSNSMSSNDAMTDSGVDMHSPTHQQKLKHDNMNNGATDVLVSSYERQLADLQLRERELIENVTKADEELSKLRASYVSLKRRTELSETQYHSSRQANVQLQSQLQEAEARAQALAEQANSQQQALNSRVSELTDEVDVLGKELQGEQQLHTKLRSTYDLLKSKFDELSANLLKSEDDSKQLKQKFRDAKQTITLRDSQISDQQHKISQLTAEIEDMKKTMEEQKKITDMIHKITSQASK